MPFEPKPGMCVDLNGKTFEFSPLETSNPPSIFVYGEQGKEATVYHVVKDKKAYALKVFHPKYQNKRLIKTVKILNRLKDIDGLLAAERTIIESNSFPNLIKEYPELNYSVLMPWISGRSWGNLIETNDDLTFEQYLKIAKAFITIMRNLEVHKIAHCDISNNSFMIEASFTSIQLIDLENLFVQGMPRPIPEISYGTPGYRSRWIAENGLWNANGDRFAVSILCAEMLTWDNKDIRNNRARADSFFAEEEVGRSSARFNYMSYCLEKLNLDLAVLFQKAWFSNSVLDCPSIFEWEKIINKF